jgi:hypothetical protein
MRTAEVRKTAEAEIWNVRTSCVPVNEGKREDKAMISKLYQNEVEERAFITKWNDIRYLNV